MGRRLVSERSRSIASILPTSESCLPRFSMKSILAVFCQVAACSSGLRVLLLHKATQRALCDKRALCDDVDVARHACSADCPRGECVGRKSNPQHQGRALSRVSLALLATGLHRDSHYFVRSFKYSSPYHQLWLISKAKAKSLKLLLLRRRQRVPLQLCQAQAVPPQSMPQLRRTTTMTSTSWTMY